MKKILIAFSLLLPLLSKAQFSLNNGTFTVFVGGTLYSESQFNNAGSLEIGSGATVTLNGGSASGVGTIKSTNTSNLIIGGTGTSGSYCFNSSFNILKNLTLTGTASATLCNYLNITGGSSPGTVIVGPGTTLNAGIYLYLKSDANGTASIGTSTGTISNSIVVERFIPANGRKYRFLASPVVSGTSNQWRANNINTSGIGIQITGPTGTVDASTSSAKSAFYYEETNTTGTINDAAKWPSIDGATTLTNGKGYRVFVRGDRTISLTTTNTTNNATTIWVRGSYPSNPVSLPVTYTAGGGQGWNLVGNPYPCTIDWDLVKAQSASNYSNIDDAIYIQHPLNSTYTGGGYTSYAGGLGSGTPYSGNRYISSSQGFFVKANASSPILKISENCKVSAQQGAKIFKTTDEPSHIRLKLFADTVQLDDAVIHFTEGATKNFDGKYDAYDLTGGIGFLTADLKDTLAISGFPKLQVNDVAKINMFKQTTGNYKILFTDLSTFDEGFDAYLIDNFLNTNTLIKENSIYSFNLVDDNPFTYGNTRFEIVFALTNTSSENILNRKNETQLTVHPNPATDELNINLNNANFKNSNVNITNVSGQQIMNSTMNGANAKINIEGLNIGVYFVTITNENGFNQTVKFVK